MPESAATVALHFDAGTFLVDGFERTSPAAHVPAECVWDERVGRFRAPAFRYREVVTHLTRSARAGGPAFDDRARKYNALTLTHRAVRDAFEHQRDAIAR